MSTANPNRVSINRVSIKKIFTIAIPLVAQQLFLQLQIYVDRAMLGHVKAEYFSAIGNVLTPYYAIVSIIAAVCTGTTILVAQSTGAKETAQSQSYAECSFIGNSILPVIAFVFFSFASGYMFRLMGVQSPVLEYSTAFLRIISFSLLILGLSTSAASIMQGIGITKIIMLAGIISNGINIILDWVLIFGKFGIPPMGIEGAAWASVIAVFVTAPILIIYVFTGRRIPFKLNVKNVFRFRGSLYTKVLKVGVPSGLENALWNLGNLIVVSYLNRLDVMSVGVYILIFSLEVFPMFLYMGFANAALTLIGHKTGENEHGEAVGIGLMCLRFSLFFCAVFAVLFVIFPRGILGIFTNDKSYIDHAAPFLIIVAFTMFPRAINNVIGLGIRGMGDTKWMLYGQIFGTIFVIVLSYIFIFTAKLGLLGLFITFLIDEILRGIINVLRFLRGREFFFLKPFEKLS